MKKQSSNTSHKRFKTQRNVSSMSLNSSRSKEIGADFSGGLHSRVKQRGPRWVSVKSDHSQDVFIEFQAGPTESKPVSTRVKPRDLSFESLKSDHSQDVFIEFQVGPTDSKPVSTWVKLRDLSCESLKSDHSQDVFIEFKPITKESKPVSSREKFLDLSCSVGDTNFDLHSIQVELRHYLLGQCESVSEGLEQIIAKTQLHDVYSEVFISQQTGRTTEVENLETQFRKRNNHDPPLKLDQLFTAESPPPMPQAPPSLRVVLTVGVAGIGKTFSVLKFCMDWAQNLKSPDIPMSLRAREDVELVIPLSFRELNLLSMRCCSLMELMQTFYPSLHQLSPQVLENIKVLFIFDGLDESRLSLDFSCEVVSEVTQSSEVSVLLVNLIRGHLLPHALIWITSRPAAANQLPAQYVHRVTEVRGFVTDEQKEMFFRRRFSDPEQLHTVLSYLRTSHSLLVLAQIPVFCWITSTVMDHIMRHPEMLPQTLTDLYVYFLLVQTQRKRKYEGQGSQMTSQLSSADCELLLKLGKLALVHLLRGNIMFYREDLEEVGLELTEATLHSGLCSEMFKEENVIFRGSVYSFLHLSIQEFMAALYLHISFSRGDAEEIRMFLKDWDQSSSLHVLLREGLKVSLNSPTGHLDLFIRFLHGLCVPSTRDHLRALLSSTDQKIMDKVIYNLKFMNTECLPPDRSVNIYHCLMEMKEQTFLQELQKVHQHQDIHQDQEALLQWRPPLQKLSGIVCSALGHSLQMLEQVLVELDLGKFNSSNEGRRRMLPAVRNCTRGILCDLQLDSTHFAVVCSALSSNPCHLRVLDLSLNRILDSDLESLCEALQSPNCCLEKLRLRGCGLTDIEPLLSVLRPRPPHRPRPSLREVDLRENRLQDKAMCELRALQQSATYRLDVLMDATSQTCRNK